MCLVSCSSSSPRAELFLIQFPHAVERLDFCWVVIGSNAHNSCKAQRIAAFVTIGSLNVVKRHLNSHAGVYAPPEAPIFNRVLQKILCQLMNLAVCKTGIGFADGYKTIVIAHRKGEV